jgi:hypothetical protein
MAFQAVDRWPRWEWAMWWDQTIDRWHGEGLPRELRFSQVFDIARYFGLDPYQQFWFSTTDATIEATLHHVEGMVSKRTFDEFVAPYYRQLLPRLQEHQIPLIMDTDGDVTLLVPWLKELGIAGVLPLERQAGVDGLKLRQQFPDFLFIGHFDKITMNRGEPAMRAEFERLLPVSGR